MKILIVDRDRLTSQLLLPKLEAEGHTVVVNPVRTEALALIEKEQFDLIMMDTAPLPTPRPMVIAVKKAIFPGFSYLMLMSHSASMDDVIRMGLNDYLKKPLDVEEIRSKIENAAGLVAFDRKLRDSSVDIRTDGVVFGKKPFLHLFHSALDRASRYGEQAFLLFFKVENFEIIADEFGYDAAYSECNALSHYLSRLRRQSDFLARIDKNELVLIMQRPSTGTEPADAAERFSLALKEYRGTESEAGSPCFKLLISMSLVELPMGNVLMRRSIENGT